MKKSLILLPLMLVGFFWLLSSIDRSEYPVEKQLWNIRQRLGVLAPSASVAAKPLDDLLHRCRNLAARYPHSRLRPHMYVLAGEIYALKKDFVQARAQYALVLKEFPNSHELGAVALQGIGAAYEQEKNFDEAFESYRRIVREYPTTPVGLNMPLYIANDHVRLNQTEQAAQAFQEAEAFYKKTAQDKIHSPEGFTALRYLATVYLVQGKWKEVVKVFEEILLVYGQSPYLDWNAARSVVGTINDISIQKLRDIDRPIAFYQMLIAKHPQAPLSGQLKNLVVSLQNFKQKQGAEHKP